MSIELPDPTRRDPFGGATQSSSDPTEFAGKRALVTGGTKGMGAAIVRRLVAGGATVATTARSPLPEGQAVELFVQADISTREGVDKVVREVLDRLGGLDILVNNVGGSSAPSGGVLALTDDDWQRTLDANLFAACIAPHCPARRKGRDRRGHCPPGPDELARRHSDRQARPARRGR